MEVDVNSKRAVVLPALRGQGGDFVDPRVDGVSQFLDELCRLRFILDEFLQLVVEEHATERVKCCHTSLCFSQFKKLTCFIQLSGKRCANRSLPPFAQVIGLMIRRRPGTPALTASPGQRQ